MPPRGGRQPAGRGGLGRGADGRRRRAGAARAGRRAGRAQPAAPSGPPRLGAAGRSTSARAAARPGAAALPPGGRRRRTRRPAAAALPRPAEIPRARPGEVRHVPGQLGHVGRDLVHARGDRVGPRELLVGPVDRGLRALDQRVGPVAVVSQDPVGRGRSARPAGAARTRRRTFPTAKNPAAMSAASCPALTRGLPFAALPGLSPARPYRLRCARRAPDLVCYSRRCLVGRRAGLAASAVRRLAVVRRAPGSP